MKTDGREGYYLTSALFLIYNPSKIIDQGAVPSIIFQYLWMYGLPTKVDAQSIIKGIL